MAASSAIDDYHWRNMAWLAGSCVVNALTLLIIISRSLVRHRSTKRLRTDDYLMIVSSLLLIFPHWVSRIGLPLTYEEVLIRMNNTDRMKTLYMIFLNLNCGYYLVCSIIKLAMCYFALQIAPITLRCFRLSLYLLSVAISSLGIAVVLLVLFRCQPVRSNFSFDAIPDSCIDLFAEEMSWLAIQTTFDVVLVCVPIAIVRLAKLQRHQRMTLLLVFGTSILGTICSLLKIYSQFYGFKRQLSYVEEVDMAGMTHLLADVEILMFAIGASMSVVSKKIAAILSRNTFQRSTEPGSAIFVVGNKQNLYSVHGFPGRNPGHGLVAQNDSDLELIERGDTVQRGAISISRLM